MYKQSRQIRPSVVETNSTSLELSLPMDEDYIIQIKPVSEGGDGISSRQITIPRIAGLNLRPLNRMYVFSFLNKYQVCNIQYI